MQASSPRGTIPPRHFRCVAIRAESDRCSLEQANMKVTPIGDKIVVRRLDAEEKTPGGIVLPDAAKQKPQEGRVLSVGDGRLIAGGKRAPNQVREGDKVVFLTYVGTEVSVDGDDLLILREDDILAVID